MLFCCFSCCFCFVVFLGFCCSVGKIVLRGFSGFLKFKALLAQTLVYLCALTFLIIYDRFALLVCFLRFMLCVVYKWLGE